MSICEDAPASAAAGRGNYLPKFGAAAVAGRIAACICDEHGRAVFTAADVPGESNPERGPLDGNLVYALLVAISEVNSGGKT